MTLNSIVSPSINREEKSNAPNTEQLSGSGAQSNIGSSEVMDLSFRKHSVVLELGFAEGRAVSSNQDELGYTTHATKGKEEHSQQSGPSQPYAPVPWMKATKFYSPLPLRICLRADLYPRVYFPDLTTSASLAAMDSVDLAALDFLVGAIAVVEGAVLRKVGLVLS